MYIVSLSHTVDNFYVDNLRKSSLERVTPAGKDYGFNPCTYSDSLLKLYSKAFQEKVQTHKDREQKKGSDRIKEFSRTKNNET